MELTLDLRFQKLRTPFTEQHDGLLRAIVSEAKALKCLLSDDLDAIIHRSVKVFDLDHVELRFFSEAIDSDGTNQVRVNSSIICPSIDY